ncbi:hypothetical protein K501DRAFT_204031, partial [Backusella circina FSU 941]
FRIFHDMEATTYDFSKVSALVRSQLRSALNNEASKDIGEFDRIMFGTPYQVIRDRRLKELEWADDLLGRDAISNIRTRLSKQSYEFLKKQRISCLLEGAWFPCPLINQRMSSISNSSGGGGTGSNMSPHNTNSTQLVAPNMAVGKRWRYYKLSPSKKSIMYGDFSEKMAPVLKNYEKLPHRIELGSVKEIKTIQKLYTSSLETSSANSFALYSENSIPLIEFHCSSATQASEWKDGFSMLLDKGFTSKETAEIFHALTEIGVKVKLLQIAGDRVEIPHGAVEVPPVPPGLGSGFFYAIDS